MSLLFDQNLSRRLPALHAGEFPGSKQVLLPARPPTGPGNRQGRGTGAAGAGLRNNLNLL